MARFALSRAEDASAGSLQKLSAAGGLRARRAWAATLLALLVVKVAAFLALAVNSAFVMDEYWMVVHGRFQLETLYRDLWPAKPVLYAAFFRLAHILGDGAVQVMTLARLQSAGAALAGLALLYLIARRIGRARLEALFALCVVLLFASYIEWAFVVRPEPLALLLALTALWLATGEGEARWRIVAAGFVSGLAFLTLQKAAYFNLALGLALVGDALVRRSLAAAILDGALLVLGWAVALVAYGLVFVAQGVDLVALYRHLFLGPAAVNALAGHQAYDAGGETGALRAFVGRTLVRDALPYLLCAAGLILRLPALSRTSRAERRVWIFTVVVVALVFAHRSPWPYNFVLAIPFLALWSPVPLRVLTSVPAARAAVAGLLVALVAVSFARNLAYLEHDNVFQNEVVGQAEAFLAPADTYADGIGMVATRRQAGARWPGQVESWDQGTLSAILGRARAGDPSHLDRLFAAGPKLWILSYRTRALEPVLEPYLAGAYLPVAPNILLAGTALPPGGEVGFRTWWAGAYRPYRADGTPSDAPYLVDGAAVSGVVRLDQGRHALRSLAEEEIFLLPADVRPPPGLDQPAEQRPLFDRPYTF